MNRIPVRKFLLASFALLLTASVAVWLLQPPQSADGQTVLIWVSDENPARQQQARLFEKLHPNIKVVIDPVNAGPDKVIVQSMAGVGPDVFDAMDCFQVAAFAKSGIALDVTDELKKDGIDVQTETFSGGLASSIYDGRTYGIPTNIAADGIWADEDALKAAGIVLPSGGWTWDQFIPIAQRLTLRDTDGRIRRYGFLFDWSNWRHFFCGFGARVFNENGTRSSVDSPYAVAAVQLMFDLVHKYHVSPTPIEQTSMATEGGFGSGFISLFAAKRGALALGGRWWLSELRKAKDLNLRVFESPFGLFRRSHGYGRSLLVNRNSKHMAEALELQRFMASDPYLDLINDQADGLASFLRANRKPSFQFNPKFPKERDNEVWLHITERGVGDDTSPFIDMSTVSGVIQVQLDMVQSGQKTPADAMKDAAASINGEIARAITEDPQLRARYNRALQEVPH